MPLQTMETSGRTTSLPYIKPETNTEANPQLDQGPLNNIILMFNKYMIMLKGIVLI